MYEKIVWALKGTPIALVLVVRDLCGEFLCGINENLGKGLV